jgi:hypothetical protein
MPEQFENVDMLPDKKIERLPSRDDTLAPESPLGASPRRSSPLKEAMIRLKGKKGSSKQGSREPFTPEEKEIVHAVAQGVSPQTLEEQRMNATQKRYAIHAAQIENQQRLIRETIAKAKPARKIKEMRAAFEAKPSNETLDIDRIPTRSEIREESSFGALSRRATEGFLGGSKMPASSETDEEINNLTKNALSEPAPFAIEPEPVIDVSSMRTKEEPKGFWSRAWSRVKSWF